MNRFTQSRVRRSRRPFQTHFDTLEQRSLLSLLGRYSHAAAEIVRVENAEDGSHNAAAVDAVLSDRAAARRSTAARGAATLDFASVGGNTYFLLQPGLTLTLEGIDDGEFVQVIITVLNETQMVDGVETRVVEERESADGQLIEVSRNFFAVDRNTNDVYYFGEDVDDYENGVIVGHDGAWRSGVDGARFGLIMPANPQRGMTYMQENAPGVAEDTGLVLGFRRNVRTPAGTFQNVLAVRETSPLDQSASIKFYAPGVGMIRDDKLKLVNVTRPLDLTSTGRNTYFILEPGHTLTFEGEEDGDQVQLVVTVLNETQTVDGVETRVVEERETVNGALVEVSRNFFAIDRGTGDVYYFGEDVDDYENGVIVGHDGAWRSGVDGAQFGLFQPGAPRRGMEFKQEDAPGVAEDTGRVVGFRRNVRVPAGTFQNVLAVRETTPLEPGAVSNKLYAPGVGMIVDDILRLVNVTPA